MLRLAFELSLVAAIAALGWYRPYQETCARHFPALARHLPPAEIPVAPRTGPSYEVALLTSVEFEVSPGVSEAPWQLPAGAILTVLAESPGEIVVGYGGQPVRIPRSFTRRILP